MKSDRSKGLPPVFSEPETPHKQYVDPPTQYTQHYNTYSDQAKLQSVYMHMYKLTAISDLVSAAILVSALFIEHMY